MLVSVLESVLLLQRSLWLLLYRALEVVEKVIGIV